MRTVRQLLEGKKPGVITIDATEPVRAAIQLMADYFIGALPVLEGGRLAGIVSERDYARKVVLMGRKSTETLVGTIMSAPVIHVGPAQTVNECMKLMTEKRIRHLPVVEDGALVGVISIGDCVKAVIDEQKHEIDDLRVFHTRCSAPLNQTVFGDIFVTSSGGISIPSRYVRTAKPDLQSRAESSVYEKARCSLSATQPVSTP